MTKEKQTPAADPVAVTLRSNSVRAEEVDDAMVGMQLTDPTIIFKPEGRQFIADLKTKDLNEVIDARWLSDIPLSLTRMIGLKPEASGRLSQVMVDTVLAQPAGTQGILFTAVQSGAVNTPITEYELYAMRGYPKYPVTKEMNVNRVIPISKPASVFIGAAFAEADPAGATARQPLDAKAAAAILPACLINDNSPNAPDVPQCLRAGMGHTLQRQGNKR